MHANMFQAMDGKGSHRDLIPVHCYNYVLIPFTLSEALAVASACPQQHRLGVCKDTSSLFLCVR